MLDAPHSTTLEQFSSKVRRLSKLSVIRGESARRPALEAKGFRPYKVSTVGQMTLPVTARQRWGIRSGGKVIVADLGYAILILPEGGWQAASDTWLRKDRVIEALDTSALDRRRTEGG